MAAALLVATAGSARADVTSVGYGSARTPADSQSYCDAGQPCTYLTDGSSAVIPADGTLRAFTVAHGAAPDGQHASLVLLTRTGGGWTVDATSESHALSAAAGSDSFTLGTPLTARRGEAIGVTVVPPAGAAAANVLVPAGGSGANGQGCASAPAAGSPATGCNVIASYDTVPALTAELTSTAASGGSTAGGSSTGSTGSGSATGGGGSAGGSSPGTIPWYTAHGLTPYKAAEVVFYRATIIEPLPPEPPIAALPAHGWSISAPAVCNALCVYAGTVLAYNVGVWYSDAADVTAAPARPVTLGTVREVGKGALAARIALRRAYRRALLRVRHPVGLVVVSTVTDKRYGFVKRRTQTLVLRPH